MAKVNYLIKGLSGTGKTSVRIELERRGHHAIEADEHFGYYEDPTAPVNLKWDKARVERTLSDLEKEISFVCGGSMNDHEFVHHFGKIFKLYADDETLRRRLVAREKFQDKPEELEALLAWNRYEASHPDAIIIDAARPVEEVVDDILAQLER